MSETLQGPDQQSTDQPLSSLDFSALYKEQNPNAVDNYDKAHVEAAEGSTKETDAAHFRKAAIEDALAAQTPGMPEGEKIEKLKTATNLLKGVKEAEAFADAQEDAAGVLYDQAQKIIDQTKPRS